MTSEFSGELEIAESADGDDDGDCSEDDWGEGAGDVECPRKDQSGGSGNLDGAGAADLGVGEGHCCIDGSGPRSVRLSG